MAAVQVGEGPHARGAWRTRVRLCPDARGVRRPWPARPAPADALRVKGTKPRALGLSPQPGLAKWVAGREVCSRSTRHARALPRLPVAATPASPAPSAKFFSAAIRQQGESSAPASGCGDTDRVEGTARRRRRSARGGDRRRPSRDAPCPRLLAGRGRRAQRGLGRPCSPPHAPLTHLQFSSQNGAICTPQLHSGREPPSSELTHSPRT